MIIPIYRTHASIGKSILTSDLPDDKKDKGSPDSIFELAKECGQKEIFVIETTMTNIFELMKNSIKTDLKLRYGLEFKIGSEEAWFKHSFLGLNAEGVRDLMKIYSDSQTIGNGFISFEEFAQINCENLFSLCNFYDGWIHKNLLCFGTFMPFFSKEPYYQVESNHLMIDGLIESKIKSDSSRKILNTKTILYKNKSDIEAFMVYKLACSNKIGGKRPTIIDPSLDGFSSREFCLEAWKEVCNGKSY